MSPSPLGRSLFGSLWTGPGGQETQRSPHRGLAHCSLRWEALGSGLCPRGGTAAEEAPSASPPASAEGAELLKCLPGNFQLPTTSKKEPDQLWERQPPCSKAPEKSRFNHETQDGTWARPLHSQFPRGTSGTWKLRGPV